MRLATTFAACLTTFALAAPARAQHRGPLSFDFTLGGGAGAGGGEWRNRSGASADALLATTPRQRPAGAVVVGMAAAVQAPFASNDECAIGSRGQCVEDFPTFLSVSLLGGWERRLGARRRSGPAVRLLAGPSVVHANGAGEGGHRGTAGGVQGHVDLATPRVGPMAFVASFRATAVPRFHGQSLALWAGGFGFRIR